MATINCGDMPKLSNVQIYMLAKKKCNAVDIVKYPNLWVMLFNMSLKYYEKSFS